MSEPQTIRIPQFRSLGKSARSRSRQWQQFRNLFSRQLASKYLGSYFGVAWVFLQPLLLLGLYTAVFGFLFRSKVPGADTTMEYVLWLMTGLVPYFSFSESIQYSSRSITDNRNLVRNVVFPTEYLPVSAYFLGMIPLFVGLAFLVLRSLVTGGSLTTDLFLLVPTTLVFSLFCIGLGLGLASLGAFLKDLGQILPTALMLWLFLTPIFYDLKIAPGWVAGLNLFNPLCFFVNRFRAGFGFATPELEWASAGIFLGVSLLSFSVGAMVFRRLKGNFDAVL